MASNGTIICEQTNFKGLEKKRLLSNVRYYSENLSGRNGENHKKTSTGILGVTTGIQTGHRLNACQKLAWFIGLQSVAPADITTYTHKESP
jgi:hypothetical protein